LINIKKYFLSGLISLAILSLFFSQLILAVDNNSLNTSEQYLEYLISKFKETEDKFKTDNGREMYWKDWENYAKKIHPQLKITLPANMTDKQKKDYIKSSALAFLYGKNYFGLKPSSNVKVLSLECRPVPDHPTALGYSDPGPTTIIVCPQHSTTNEIFHVVLHETIHQFTPMIGQSYEDKIQSRLRYHLPKIFSNNKNYPAKYDIFSSKQSPTTRGFPINIQPTKTITNNQNNTLNTFIITPAAYRKDRNFSSADNLHETVHGVNGMGGRIQINQGKGNGQAIVIGLDDAGNYILAFVSEPNYTINKLVLPSFLKKKGSAYEQYVSNPQASKKTTYIMDEWSAYIMGTEDNIKMLESGKKQDNALTTFRLAEFMVMGVAFLDSTSKLDPVLYNSKSFQDIIKYEIERSAELIRKSYIIKDANGKTPLVRPELDSVINNFINSKEAESLKNILSNTYGDEWLANIISKIKK